MTKFLLGLVAALSVSLSSALAQTSDQTLPSSEEVQQSAVLTPQQVLDISASSFPDILTSIARANAAKGDQLAALGAFDLVFRLGQIARLRCLALQTLPLQRGVQQRCSRGR